MPRNSAQHERNLHSLDPNQAAYSETWLRCSAKTSSDLTIILACWRSANPPARVREAVKQVTSAWIKSCPVDRTTSEYDKIPGFA